MGYTTDFKGKFSITPKLSPAHRRYLTKFNEVRHMKRDSAKLHLLTDTIRVAVGLPIGTDGEFYVGGSEGYSDGEVKNILDHNTPTQSQPGLYCQWVPNSTGTALQWDEGEKFYNYIEWLKYIIDNFLKPWGYKLNGNVEWYGEDRPDVGTIVVVDNVVSTDDRLNIPPLEKMPVVKTPESIWNNSNDAFPSSVDFPIWVVHHAMARPTVFYTDRKLHNFTEFKWSRAHTPELPKLKLKFKVKLSQVVTVEASTVAEAKELARQKSGVGIWGAAEIVP